MIDGKFNCKFCHKELPKSEMSTVHINMCRPCHSKIMMYRRALHLGFKTEKQQKVKYIVEKQIKHNLEHGGYVPSYYNAEEVNQQCAYCGLSFKSKIQMNKCPECTKLEEQYRTLVHYYNETGIEKPQLTKLELYYLNMQRRGLKVPKAFLKRREELQ